MEHKFKVGDRVVYSLENGYKGISKDLIGKETILESFNGMYFITSEGYLVKPEDIEPIPINPAEKILDIYNTTGILIYGTNTGDEWYKQQYLNQPMANKPLSEILQWSYKISVDPYLPHIGELKGDKCKRSVEGKICQGVIDKVHEGGCGCPSGFPPCSDCTSPTYCPVCNWNSNEPEEKEITVFKFC